MVARFTMQHGEVFHNPRSICHGCPLFALVVKCALNLQSTSTLSSQQSQHQHNYNWTNNAKCITHLSNLVVKKINKC